MNVNPMSARAQAETPIGESSQAPRRARVALVGNPNCGKTALFNVLTGSRQKVANYPGVTVERKEGVFVTPAGREIVLVDLPGTYSLRGRSPDEAVTRDAIVGPFAEGERPDLVVCVADATNLRMMLRLVMEVKSAGLPKGVRPSGFWVYRTRCTGVSPVCSKAH